MSKVSQIYDMSIDEVLKLSDSHVQFLLEQAESTARTLLENNTAFKQALGAKLAPVKRAVRDEISAADTGGGATPKIDF